jgi:hypothetical protein
MADDETPKDGSEGVEDSGEARNDVVVKIGLVGDAQVRYETFGVGSYGSEQPLICARPSGWKDDSHG